MSKYPHLKWFKKASFYKFLDTFMLTMKVLVVQIIKLEYWMLIKYHKKYFLGLKFTKKNLIFLQLLKFHLDLTLLTWSRVWEKFQNSQLTFLIHYFPRFYVAISDQQCFFKFLYFVQTFFLMCIKTSLPWLKLTNTIIN